MHFWLGKVAFFHLASQCSMQCCVGNFDFPFVGPFAASVRLSRGTELERRDRIPRAAPRPSGSGIKSSVECAFLGSRVRSSRPASRPACRRCVMRFCRSGCSCRKEVQAPVPVLDKSFLSTQIPESWTLNIDSWKMSFPLQLQASSLIGFYVVLGRLDSKGMNRTKSESPSKRIS